VNRTLSILFTALALLTPLTAAPVRAQAPSYTLGTKIDPSAHYLIFFHNNYVEANGPDGECKYYEILQAFSDRGYKVISDLRPKNTSVREAAYRGATDVLRLLDSRVPAEQITVAGHSKGGLIALQVAAMVGNPKVRYAILAGCGIQGLSYPDPAKLSGDFLSLYAASDQVAGSCSSSFAKAKPDSKSQELQLDSPAGHQLFFRPAEAWLTPLTAWLNSRPGAQAAETKASPAK
jgi:pimeloyl-ACP methyl ester carboxylesterase